MNPRPVLKDIKRTRAGETGILAKVVLFAVLTGMGAVLRIPLSPVPVTMQVFFVLLSGFVLGPVWGPASQALYLVMGVSGAPFFAAPPHAGPLVLFGPTGGYLWGFVLASLVTGWTRERFLSAGTGRNSPSALVPLAASLAGTAAIYLCGGAWLGTWLGVQGHNPALVFELGVKPFILADLAKAAAVSLLVIFMFQGRKR
jgi:biotin transport system substrate-specific component